MFIWLSFFSLLCYRFGEIKTNINQQCSDLKTDSEVSR